MVCNTCIWHSLCGEDEFSVWDKNHSPSYCFKTLLGLVVFFKLLLTNIYLFGRHRRESIYLSNVEERVIKARKICSALLTATTTVHLVLVIVRNPSTPILGYVLHSVQFLTWVSHLMFLSKFCCRLGYSLRGPWIVTLFFLVTIIVDAFSLYDSVSVFQKSGSTDQYMSVINIVYNSINIFLKVIHILTLFPSGDTRAVHVNGINSEVQPLLDEPSSDAGSKLGVAAENSNIVSRLCFTWVWKLVLKGAKTELNSVSDLYTLPSELSATKNEQTLVHYSEDSRSMTDDHVEDHGASKKKKRKLLSALFKSFGFEFILIGILQFFSNVLKFVGPILLGYIVNFVENGTEPIKNGYLYASGMFASTLLAALISNQYNYLIQKVSIKMNGALCNMVYRKTISVSTSSMQSMTSGEIIDMMSTDVQRLSGIKFFHEFWSLPFQIILALYLVYTQVGVAFVTCIVYGILLIPITQYLCTKIMKFATEYMNCKDNRVKVMNEVLKGFKVIKYCVWQRHFSNKVQDVRASEVKQLKYSKYLDAVCVYFWSTTPLIMSISTFTLYILLGNELTAAKVFTCISLFDMLLIPLNAFPWVIGGLMECLVSLRRLKKVLDLNNFQSDLYYDVYEKYKAGAVKIVNGTFKWRSPDQTQSAKDSTVELNEEKLEEKIAENPFMLKSIDIDCRPGQFIGIVGKVGCGKSSLLAAISGEMFKVEGSVYVSELEKNHGVGLFTQDTWIRHGTIKDNILFGKEYDQGRYASVIECCALTEDLDSFPAGDMTEVGENGITLSGGQKARVTLARAVYQDKKTYLLDDPFAAVDPNVAAHIYNNCIRGFLKSKTIFLVTHHVSFVRSADNVIVLEDGKIIQQGPPKEVLGRESFVRSISKDETPEKSAAKENVKDPEMESKENKVVEDEEMESGAVSASVYWTFWRAAGHMASLFFIFFLVCMQGSENASELWLAHWLSNMKAAGNITLYGNTTVGHHGVKFYLTVYGSISAAHSIFTLGRAFLFAYACLNAAVVLHDKLLNSVLHATTKFFESNPLGRIINRFSSDIYDIDDMLPFLLNIVASDFVGLIGTLVVIVYSFVWVLVIIIPLAIIYYFLQRFYRKTSRQVKRISSVSLSPVFSHFTESIKGAKCIRGFSEKQQFCEIANKRVTDYLCAEISEIAAGTWFSFHLEILGVLLVSAVSLFVVLQHHVSTVDSGFVGLAISSALTINSLLCDLVIHFTETEKLMVSVERVHQYVKNTKHEPSDALYDPPCDWPSQGVIKYDNVFLKYGENSPFVLKGLSFETLSGEKIGIIGRTGSGKSSTVSLLFRIVEHQRGDIYIDGVNSTHIPLDKLRSSMSIIPQDAFLFDGTVRENLDPTNSCTDDELWNALKLCQLDETIKSMPQQLQSDVGEDGKELSVGQQQLVCLARAVLMDTKILCIDEATANVDLNTDKIIQEMIRTVFKEKTVLTIAHRLETIMHCDRIMVVSEGEIVEFNSPANLMADTSSHLYQLHHK